MTANTSSEGKVKVAPHVLSTVVAMTARSVPGVARLSDSLLSRLGRVIRRDPNPGGVRLRQTESGVFVDVNIVIQPDSNMVEVAGRVQRDVSEAVRRVAGASICEVNVHIQDVN